MRFNIVALAWESCNELPNRFLYGANYQIQSYWEIMEILAFLEIREEQRRMR